MAPISVDRGVRLSFGHGSAGPPGSVFGLIRTGWRALPIRFPGPAGLRHQRPLAAAPAVRLHRPDRHVELPVGHLLDPQRVEQLAPVGAERREQQAQKKVKPVHGVLVEGLDNCLIKFSRCCTPIPGDDIVGYITRGQGVSIHRTDCANYARREFKPEDIGRWINVSWADEIKESYATAITVVSRERNGLIMDIASIFNTLNTKVRTINARDTGDKSIVNITLETSGIDELRAVVNRISALPGVVEVKRNGGKR